jgi:sialate O-acetylesterase
MNKSGTGKILPSFPALTGSVASGLVLLLVSFCFNLQAARVPALIPFPQQVTWEQHNFKPDSTLCFHYNIDQHEQVIRETRVKVACVGNSVTFGYGLMDPGKESYPFQLGNMLEAKYEVRNFGKSGATLLSKGHNPYIKSEEYQQALDFHPDIVIIDLGLNDTDPRNWPAYYDEFIPDYQRLIRSFKTATGESPGIYVCTMTPVLPGHPRFNSGTRDWFYQIQESINAVARNTGAYLVDLYTPLFRRPDLFTDNLHPNAEGAAIIARTVYSALSGDSGGFRLAPAFSEHMVVQQKKPVVLYGSSDRGDQLEIRFAAQSRQLTTTGDGHWEIVFSPVPAGGPYSLQIRVNGTLMTDWKDILSGEVWLCSGQSNMAFELKKSENGLTAANEANDPELRLFNYKGFIQTDNIEFDQASLDRINRLDYFEGVWQNTSPEVAAEFSAIGYFFGLELRKKLNVPVGLIQVAVGGAPIESFIDRKSLSFNPVLVNEFLNRGKNDFIFEWVRQRIATNISLHNSENQRHPYDPAYIFESGIAPLGKFPIRGVIWYQGESNAHNPELYRIAFREFIHSWRQFRNDDKMPFIMAQLSGIDRPSWPRFRDVQRQLVDDTPYTGLVVTSDLGDSLNVHPVRKKEVGYRFALQALNKVYKKKQISDGPVPDKTVKKQDAVVIKFRTCRKLRTSDGKTLRELEIAGNDGIFRETYGIIHGNKIIIKEPVENVHAIRYAWSPYTHGNLVNRQNLPASTFLLNIN